MATTQKTTASKQASATEAAEASLAQMQRAGFGQMAWMSAAMAETLAALGSEVVQFVSNRVTEDFKTQHALLNCKDLTEAQRIQLEFVQRALEQYTAETGRLVQLSAGVMNAAMPGRKKDNDPV